MRREVSWHAGHTLIVFEGCGMGQFAITTLGSGRASEPPLDEVSGRPVKHSLCLGKGEVATLKEAIVEWEVENGGERHPPSMPSRKEVEEKARNLASRVFSDGTMRTMLYEMIVDAFCADAPHRFDLMEARDRQQAIEAAVHLKEPVDGQVVTWGGKSYVKGRCHADSPGRCIACDRLGYHLVAV